MLVAAPTLATVVVVAALLMLLLFALVAWQNRTRIYEEAAENALKVARTLEEHALKVIGGTEAELRQLRWVVAELGWDRLEHDPRFYGRMRSVVLAPEAESVWLADASGDVRLTTMSFPAPDLNVAKREWFTAHLAAPAGLYVGKVTRGLMSGETFFPVSQRIDDASGHFSGVAQVSLRPSYFSSFYASVMRAEQASVQLLRRDGSVIVRYPQLSGDATTLRQSDSFLAAMDAAPEGTFTTMSTFDGVKRLYAYRKLDPLPLYVVVGISTASLQYEWMTRVALYAGFAVPALALLAVLGWLAYRRTQQVDAAQEQLRLANARLEQHVAERTHDLEKSLAEKDVLLREIHHRVKNNLQVIASLLSLHGRQFESMEVQRSFTDCLTKVRSMGLVHELLYQASNLAAVDLGAYLRSLTAHFTALYSERANIRLQITAESVPLDIDTIVPLGLIVTEIITNAYKHAFPAERAGTIALAAGYGADGRIFVSVSDDGVGLPADWDRARRRSLGMKLVDVLAEQLEARLEYAAAQGTSVTVTLTARRAQAA